MYRRRSRQRPLPNARHRQGQRVENAGPGYGRTHPLQCGSGRRHQHFRQALLPLCAAADHYGSRDQGRRRTPGDCDPACACWLPQGHRFPRVEFARSGRSADRGRVMREI